MKKYNFHNIESLIVTRKEEVGNSDFYKGLKGYIKENGVYYRQPAVIIDYVDGSFETIYFDDYEKAEKRAEWIYNRCKKFWILKNIKK